jgi:hypothetical protein
MTIEIVKIDGMRDAVIFEMERDTATLQLALRPQEVCARRAEGDVENAAIMICTLGSLSGKERDSRPARSNKGRHSSPSVFVHSLETKHLHVSCGRALNVRDRDCYMIQSIQFRRQNIFPTAGLNCICMRML